MAARAVLFDLGDTLVFQAHEPDLNRLYSAMGGQVHPLFAAWDLAPPERLERLLHDLYQAVAAAQPRRRQRGLEVDGAYIARGALAAYGVEVSPEQAGAFWNATGVGHDIWGNQLYPDALDTLRKLHNLAVPVVLVSNNWYPAAVERLRLAALGVTDELLPAIVTSADVMRAKAAPEPFLRALQLLRVDATDGVFVGDDLDADMRGAKALGMTTVWKLNGRHEVAPEPEADHMIHDLWELFTLGVLPEATEAALPQESLTPHEDANADRY